MVDGGQAKSLLTLENDGVGNDVQPAFGQRCGPLGRDAFVDGGLSLEV
ncbi:hypothetical protein [Burkholderia multivorans]|nr:hypothetical protein [Burkholderia multivorans]SAJ97032.1 hypothetical protein UA12_05609 [Burkholderia multivorans]